MPSRGEMKMNRTGLTHPGRMSAPNPALAIAAPPYPPSSAWLEEVGRPKYQVMRSQTIAPRRAG